MYIYVYTSCFHLCIVLYLSFISSSWRSPSQSATRHAGPPPDQAPALLVPRWVAGALRARWRRSLRRSVPKYLRRSFWTLIGLCGLQVYEYSKMEWNVSKYQFCQNIKNIKYTKVTKYATFTKYELCNLYIWQNRNLDFWVFPIVSKMFQKFESILALLVYFV